MNVLLFSTSRRRKKHFSAIAENMPADINCTVLGDSDKLPKPDLSFYSKAKEINFDEAMDFTVKHREITKSHKIPVAVKKAYKLYGFVKVLQLANFLNSGNYDLIIIWNGYDYIQKLIVEVAKMYGIGVAYMENGLLPNTTTIDTKGINFNNSLPREASFYKALNNQKPFVKPENLVAREVKGQKSISEEHKELPENYIFVPFQVDNDSQIICNSPHIKNMEELFLICAEVQKNLKDQSLKFVFKEHPSSQFEYPKLIGMQTENLLFINNTNTQELIQKSQAVLTINSTVGIEALIFEKKVIVVGNAFYSIDGIVKSASTPSDLVDIIDNINSWFINTELTQKFLAYIQHSYAIKGSWKNPDSIFFTSLSDKIIKT